MAYTLDELTKPLTRDEVKARIYTTLAAIGVKTTGWKPGATARTIIAAVSIVASAFSALQADIAKSGFLELATGDWLTLVARHVFGVERIVATFATGQVTLTNAAGGVYSYGPEDVLFVNATSNATYRNTGSISLAAMGTTTVAVRAVEAGAGGTAAPGQIDTLGTSMNGVSVSNALPVAGRDDETDPELRARCLSKLGSLSPFGSWDAYDYAARNAARTDGGLVGITRVRTKKDGFGVLTVYVATPAGGVTGTVGDPSTDLGAVDEAVDRRAGPLAVTVITLSATPLVVPVTYTVSMYNTSGLTEAAIKALIAARLVAFFSAQPIGGNRLGVSTGKVYADAIRTAIGSTLPQIFHVLLTLPAGDVTIAVEEVPVLGTIVPNVVQVPPTEGAP